MIVAPISGLCVGDDLTVRAVTLDKDQFILQHGGRTVSQAQEDIKITHREAPLPPEASDKADLDHIEVQKWVLLQYDFFSK